MASVTRYVWQRKSSTGNYGWVPWQEARLPRVEQDAATGHWGVLDTDGSQLCLCVDRKGAERVAKRLRLAVVDRCDSLGVAILTRRKDGWHYGSHQHVCDYGMTFLTRAEAEAYIEAEPHPSQRPLSLYLQKPSPEPSEGPQSPQSGKKGSTTHSDASCNLEACGAPAGHNGRHARRGKRKGTSALTH